MHYLRRSIMRTYVVITRAVWLAVIAPWAWFAAVAVSCFPGPLDVSDGAATTRVEPDADAEGEIADDTDTLALNSCGGLGALLPGEPGTPCGTCGQLACAEDDPDRTSTVCEAPADGCPITCAVLGCASLGRACVEAAANSDAQCEGCLSSHVAIGELCVLAVSTPEGVTATLDRVQDVEVKWDATTGATGYRVERCSVATCNESDWSELAVEPLAATSYIDTATFAPELPSAPNGVEASRDLHDRSTLSWQSVLAPAAPRYRYRVTAIGPANESEPSEAVEGARAERPVIGYEVRVDQGPWSLFPESQTSFDDFDAPPATIDLGVVTATTGTYAEFVRLSVGSVEVQPGSARHYEVRATTAYGFGPPAETTGWRSGGNPALGWERSTDSSGSDFEPIEGANAATFDDVNAPSDGSTRWYRVRAEADGATSVISDAVFGSRQPPPGVPAGVLASSNLTDHVHVSWGSVSGAIGYHVYRDGARLTTGTGITGTSYLDLEAVAPADPWLAPTALVASTDDPTAVHLNWTAPTQPIGPQAHYRVSAVNSSGEGELSAEAIGRRVAPALVGYEIEVAPMGGDVVWISTGTTEPEWDHISAPRGQLVGGDIEVSTGDHRLMVTLEVDGFETVPPPVVSYRVRGVLQGSPPSYTPSSADADGSRALGTVMWQWQRSADASALGFTDLADAAATSAEDTTAPADGGKRWYRATATGPGITTRTFGPVEGWRLAFVAVDGGQGHACAVTSDGGVWCWGRNHRGQLGHGTTDAEPSPAPVVIPQEAGAFVEIALGFSHSCARTATGEVWCWGDNASGQLGDSSNTLRSIPVRVVGVTEAVSLAVGAAHGCVATAGGAVQCWGRNINGQLGDNSTTDTTTPVAVRTGPSTYLSDVLDVAAGQAHSCARRANDSWCWGANFSGSLGDDSTQQREVAVTVTGLTTASQLAAGYEHTCARLGASAVCWGDNDSGQLGDNSTTDRLTAVPVVSLTTVVALQAMNETSCARLSSGFVFCWGSDSQGQLGDGGSNISRSSPQKVQGLADVSAIGTGHDHACAIFEGGVWCWGFNGIGALGDGTTSAISSPVPVLLP